MIGQEQPAMLAPVGNAPPRRFVLATKQNDETLKQPPALRQLPSSLLSPHLFI
jgi:hypothetical protein